MTRKVILDQNWTQVSEGPVYLEAGHHCEVFFCFEEASPDENKTGYHRLNYQKPDFAYSGSGKCFCKSGSVGENYLVITEVV